MRIRIEPGAAVGKAPAPPSKSFGHRALICAALSDGESFIRNVPDNQDMDATLDCLCAMGIPWTRSECGVRVRGGNRDALRDAVFPCRESGSTLRFLIPAGLARGGSMLFTGSERLLERGIPVYETLCREQGILVERTDRGFLFRGKIRGNQFRISGRFSSQYVTGILLILPLLGDGSWLEVLPPVESRPYIGITRAVMRTFGAGILEPEENRFCLEKGAGYRASEYIVEGDWSGAAFFYAMNALGSRVLVTGLNPESIQGDRAILGHLQALKSGEPAIDLSDCPDLGPALFAVAAAENGAVFTGTERLRNKESDRVRCMTEELAKFGVCTEIGTDFVRVRQSILHTPDYVLFGHNDHRIVMALSVLMMLTGGELEGAEAVSKSFPGFFDQIEELGVKVIHETAG